ncbi:HTTM domain-containing protein [Pseudenhygromyxa sp. WMMC2535]|uniref:HTTM domain-containing protein n=1 Tax=Pseudenhygromyxa sp. WMMC2535 TaxID=2712867 RepID=UPI001556083D|nr:HTTM domain-containing protein [Pseudenhygromyxa sp. WMMC2535]NVB36920.1 HTTM domain-containing protein [Pseudenhygromyxa sp. WMMC2535]
MSAATSTSPASTSGRGGPLAALERWWLPTAPALRLASLRVLVTAFALTWLGILGPLLTANLRFPAARFEPVGVLAMFSAPPPAALVVGLWLATLAAGVAALLGWRFRVSGPLFALGLLWVTSYRNSWGMIFHTENLVVLHALILALTPASDSWSLDARRRGGPAPAASPAYGWGPKLMATVTVLAYLIAGVAKLRNAGAPWLEGEVLLSHVAWDNLRKIELGDLHSPLGAWLSRYPAIFVPLAWASMVLELGAPLAIIHRKLAWPWAVGMWSFHLGVLMIMAIMFPYPLSAVAFAPLFAIEEPARRLGARLRRASWMLARPRLIRLLPQEND